MNNTHNWILTLYDKYDNVIEEVEVNDRTEKEMEREAQYYIRTCKETVEDFSFCQYRRPIRKIRDNKRKTLDNIKRP
jgi:hypothetical protein